MDRTMTGTERRARVPLDYDAADARVFAMIERRRAHHEARGASPAVAQLCTYGELAAHASLLVALIEAGDMERLREAIAERFPKESR
jgi:hypothetical protein